jgi:hypothetical protein
VSLTATYTGALSRVELVATALGGDATYAVVERSLNSALWFPVRGGLALPVESEGAQLHDYEFFADAANQYRITSYDADDAQQEQFTASITVNLNGVAWLKSLRYPANNRPITVVDWSDVSRPDRSAAHPVVGRSTPVGTGDLHLSPQFTLEVLAESAAQAGELDVIVAAGGTWLIHTPAGCPFPGGYVRIGQVDQTRRTRSARSDRRYFTLPCTVVTPPAPQVVGSTLVAQTLFRLYGDATALYAAHSTGRSLLATIGSPNDQVVL